MKKQIKEDEKAILKAINDAVDQKRSMSIRK